MYKAFKGGDTASLGTDSTQWYEGANDKNITIPYSRKRWREKILAYSWKIAKVSPANFLISVCHY